MNSTVSKISVGFNVLLLSAAVYFGCQSNEQAQGQDGQQAVAMATQGENCMGYNNVGLEEGQLNMNLVRTMAYNYQNEVGKDATHSVWFDLATIKQFVYAIESKVTTCEDSLGVRIYFAKYPVDYSWTNIFTSDLNEFRTQLMNKYHTATNPYADINTVIMVPTIRNNGMNFDFNPADPKACINKTYDNEIYGDNRVNMVTDPNLGNVPEFATQALPNNIPAIIAQNHGESCPPMKCSEIGSYFDYFN